MVGLNSMTWERVGLRKREREKKGILRAKRDGIKKSKEQIPE